MRSHLCQGCLNALQAALLFVSAAPKIRYIIDRITNPKAVGKTTTQANSRILSITPTYVKAIIHININNFRHSIIRPSENLCH